MLSRERILELFAELDDELGKGRTRGDVFVVGGFTTVDEGLAVLADYYPGRPIEAKVQFFLEELVARPPSDPPSS